jgi:DnaJ-class molecular chaperone
VDYRFTYAGAMYVRIRMLSYHNARRYTELQRYVREQNPLFSPSTFGLYFNPETDSFFDMTQFITEEDNRRAESINYLNECNDLYRRSYDNIVRQQQEEAQQAQAIAGVISNALSTISNGLSGSSGGSTATRQNNRVANNRSNSSSSSSSSSGNDTSSPTRHTCPRCDGKGKIEVEHNVNGGLQKRMKTCSECGKTYDSAATGHHHERCNSCRGLGYYEIK